MVFLCGGGGGGGHVFVLLQWRAAPWFFTGARCEQLFLSHDRQIYINQTKTCEWSGNCLLIGLWNLLVWLNKSLLVTRLHECPSVQITTFGFEFENDSTKSCFCVLGKELCYTHTFGRRAVAHRFTLWIIKSRWCPARRHAFLHTAITTPTVPRVVTSPTAFIVQKLQKTCTACEKCTKSRKIFNSVLFLFMQMASVAVKSQLTNHIQPFNWAMSKYFSLKTFKVSCELQFPLSSPDAFGVFHSSSAQYSLSGAEN